MNLNNLEESLKAKGYNTDTILEAMQNAKDLRNAGYNEDTVVALYESYLEEGITIEGEFTLEKLMQAVDPDQAWTDFWEDTNA